MFAEKKLFCPNINDFSTLGGDGATVFDLRRSQKLDLFPFFRDFGSKVEKMRSKVLSVTC